MLPSTYYGGPNVWLRPTMPISDSRHHSHICAVIGVWTALFSLGGQEGLPKATVALQLCSCHLSTLPAKVTSARQKSGFTSTKASNSVGGDEIDECRKEITKIENDIREADLKANSNDPNERAYWRNRADTLLKLMLEKQKLMLEKQKLMLEKQAFITERERKEAKQIDLIIERERKETERERNEAQKIYGLIRLGKIGGKGLPNDVRWIVRASKKASIHEDKMHFVNRDNAITQLQEVHRSNYNRQASRTGRNWFIPLCDNLFGMGKSEFSQQYIDRCRSAAFMPEAPVNFAESLCRAQTVPISFPKGELADPAVFEERSLAILQSTLIPLFEVAPRCVYKYYRKTNEFLKELTHEAGPVFIAVDEIGRAFDDDNKDDVAQRELFLKFCASVLQSWLELPNVFFLVLGRGSFLSYVGVRPDGFSPQIASPCEFRRLSLQSLRVDAIKEILENTLHTDDVTLTKYYNLDEQMALKVAEHLFDVTSGIPRLLLNAFVGCKTSAELMAYDGSYEFNNYIEIYSYFKRFRKEIQKMLDAAEIQAPVDLSARIRYEERSLPREIIANNALIAWEGTLEKATLLPNKKIVQFFGSYFTVFREYLELLAKSRKLPLDYPDAFEVLLIKRFQEIFSAPKRPSDVLPSFFDTPVFGGCENLVLNNGLRPMPQILPEGKGDSLSSPTAPPRAWPGILREMEQSESLCLKPPLRSASPDALFVGTVRRSSEDFRYVCGIASKNYVEGKTSVSMAMIDEECGKFNVIFEGSDENEPKRLRILFICASGYDVGIKKRFVGKKFHVLERSKKWKYIDEIILLDLTSEQNRAEFFGLTKGDVLGTAIEKVIAKVNAYYTE